MMERVRGERGGGNHPENELYAIYLEELRICVPIRKIVWREEIAGNFVVANFVVAYQMRIRSDGAAAAANWSTLK